MRATVFAFVLASAPVLCVAGDRGFDAVVRRVEARYQTRPMHIPLLGLARFVVGAARPYGAKGFQLAVFENLPAVDGEDMAGIAPPGAEWQLVTKVVSTDGETTLMYARPAGTRIKMLIVTRGSSDATVVGMELSPERFARQALHAPVE